MHHKILRNHFKKIILCFLIVVYYYCLPKQLFKAPTSTVVTASKGELLGAVIAKDGQWRFPKSDSVPEKFKHCIVQFEDAYFYKHFGFNPVSIGKAMLQNFKAKRIVRGGSTLSQQVIRISRNNKPRSYFEKLYELILATRLEFRYSKDEILNLYTTYAPFGGNVVGLEAASWRYYGLSPSQLSWAESATLAVLPNAPSLIYPGKNQLRLKRKRDLLLKKIYQSSIIDSLTYQLALAEDLPKKPFPLPIKAPHLVQDIALTHKGKRIQSSIDYHLQEQINLLAKQHYQIHRQNEVHNLAVLVLDVESRKVKAYIGNAPTDKAHQKDVNIVKANRSTGSVMKPFLYGQMLSSGDLLPSELLPDIPTEIAGFSPQNFNLSYDGAVPADKALTRSLNIPAVRMLQSYGLAKFRADLDDYKLTGITRSANYYGLSLILGGAEASLWDLCKVYAGYSGLVSHYEDLSHQYFTNEFVNPSYLQQEVLNFGKISQTPQILDAGAAFTTLQTLTEVNRPESEQSWKYFESSQKIAWKTGTSFGNKDAWAIGVTPKYVVGVWLGNADGEGRPNLTGASSAAPLLFSVFNILPKSDWFLQPFEDLIQQDICDKSGLLALPICESTLKWIPKNGIRAQACKYHKEIQLDSNQQYRVHSACESISNIVTTSWFDLPPLMAYYYKQTNIDYRSMPSFRSDCHELSLSKMDFLYPTRAFSKLSVTKSIEGKLQPIVLKLTHSSSDAKVYWYVNKEFKKQTSGFHELSIKPSEGIHKITVVDHLGNELQRVIEID